MRVAVSKNRGRNYLEPMVNVGVFVDDLQPRPSVVDDGELQFPPRSQAWCRMLLRRWKLILTLEYFTVSTLRQRQLAWSVHVEAAIHGRKALAELCPNRRTPMPALTFRTMEHKGGTQHSNEHRSGRTCPTLRCTGKAPTGRKPRC